MCVINGGIIIPYLNKLSGAYRPILDLSIHIEVRRLLFYRKASENKSYKIFG